MDDEGVCLLRKHKEPLHGAQTVRQGTHSSGRSKAKILRKAWLVWRRVRHIFGDAFTFSGQKTENLENAGFIQKRGITENYLTKNWL